MVAEETVRRRRRTAEGRRVKRPKVPKTPDGRMPVMDHLRELRRRVIWIMLIVAFGAVFGWIFYTQLLDFLKDPYCNVPKKYRATSSVSGQCVLIYHGVLDGFTTRLKVSVIAGAVATGPFWLYQIWAFITPGLRRNEKKYTLWFIATSTILFVAGVALAYLMLYKGLPIIIEQAGSGTAAQLTVSDYISFVVLMLVIFGAAFELPLLVVMANFAGVLPSKLLKKSRRIAVFLIFLFAAVATPTTDPFTMIAMAVPMVVLFEVAIQVASLRDRRRAARKAEQRAADQLEDDVASTVDPIPRALTSGVETGPEMGTHDWADTT